MAARPDPPPLSADPPTTIIFLRSLLEAAGFPEDAARDIASRFRGVTFRTLLYYTPEYHTERFGRRPGAVIFSYIQEEFVSIL